MGKSQSKLFTEQESFNFYRRFRQTKKLQDSLLIYFQEIQTLKQYAVKQIYVRTDQEEDNLFELISLKTKLKFKYLINFQHIYKFPDHACSSYDKYWILFQYSSKTLSDVIKSRKQQNKCFSEKEILVILKSCVKTLKFMQQKNMVFGFPSPNNILITIDNNILIDDPWIKSKYLDPHLTIYENIEQQYRSPETKLKKFEKQSVQQQQKAYVYGIGIILLQVIYLKQLKEVESSNIIENENMLKKLISSINELNNNMVYNKNLFTILEKMTLSNQFKRFSYDQIILILQNQQKCKALLSNQLQQQDQNTLLQIKNSKLSKILNNSSNKTKKQPNEKQNHLADHSLTNKLTKQKNQFMPNFKQSDTNQFQTTEKCTNINLSQQQKQANINTMYHSYMLPNSKINSFSQNSNKFINYNTVPDIKVAQVNSLDKITFRTNSSTNKIGYNQYPNQAVNIKSEQKPYHTTYHFHKSYEIDHLNHSKSPYNNVNYNQDIGYKWNEGNNLSKKLEYTYADGNIKNQINNINLISQKQIYPLNKNNNSLGLNEFNIINSNKNNINFNIIKNTQKIEFKQQLIKPCYNYNNTSLNFSNSIINNNNANFEKQLINKINKPNIQNKNTILNGSNQKNNLNQFNQSLSQNKSLLESSLSISNDDQIFKTQKDVQINLQENNELKFLTPISERSQIKQNNKIPAKNIQIDKQEQTFLLNSLLRTQSKADNKINKVEPPIENPISISESSQKSYLQQIRNIKLQLKEMKYEGEQKNNQREGFGKLSYSDGGYYLGYWKRNMMHGEGKLYFYNAQLVYDGNWTFNKFNGYGKLYNIFQEKFYQKFNYKNMNQIKNYWSYYEGNFKEDMKHGPGKLYFTNGQSFSGNFINDRIEGRGKFETINYQMIQGIWKNGQLS